MEALRISRILVFAVLILLYERLWGPSVNGACAQSVLSALWILTWSLFRWVTSLPHRPCPFRRILWHQDLWSQAHKHHPGLISEGFMRLGQPRLRPGSDHHPSSFVCSFVFCLFVSVGYYGYLYLFQVLVSFSCGCPSSLRVIFPVIVPTSLRVSCTEESMVRKWIFRLILLLPPSRAWFFHLFPNLLKETRLWN